MTSQGFTAYTLLVNGGSRQDVQQVHFHLTVEHGLVQPFENFVGAAWVMETADYTVYRLEDVERFHLALVPKQLMPPLLQWEQSDLRRFSRTALPLLELERFYRLSSRGFSLVIQESSDFEKQNLVVHLTAGKLQGE
jgi:hypothetical protein